MAAFTKLASGSWRAQVRRKGRYVSETFLRREDARTWATEAERSIDRGLPPAQSRVKRLRTFGELIDLHVADMKEVGRAPGRSKDATLAMLRRELGELPVEEIDRERLVKFGRKRAAESAGPVTVRMDIGAIRLVDRPAPDVASGPAVRGRPGGPPHSPGLRQAGARAASPIGLSSPTYSRRSAISNCPGTRPSVGLQRRSCAR